jgi:hypothetical protein
MSAFPTVAISGLIMSLALMAGLVLATNASAQTIRQTAHRKVHPSAPRVEQPLPRSDELQMSTSVSTGSENHYYSDTIASFHTDWMDMSSRYGQSPSNEYNDFYRPPRPQSRLGPRAIDLPCGPLLPVLDSTDADPEREHPSICTGGNSRSNSFSVMARLYRFSAGD